MKAIILISAVLLANVALADPAKVIKDGYGCQDKKMFQTLHELDGKPALKAALAKQVKSGACIMLKKGTAVETTGENFMLDLVRIQIGGKGKNYWTSAKFVE